MVTTAGPAPDTEMPRGDAEVRIVAFLCNWCSYTGADLAGISRIQWDPSVHIVRVMCSGRMDPTFVAKAFEMGADGVIVSGCHPGDCHYQEGNYNALRRFELLRLTLRQFGIEDERVRLEWISASEGDRVQKVCNEMTEQIRALGPLRLTVASDRHGTAASSTEAPELVGQVTS